MASSVVLGTGALTAVNNAMIQRSGSIINLSSTSFAGIADGKAATAQGVPLKRIGTREEIAQVILFLASDKANFVTGEIVHINGGKRAL
jgi:enoyl-[acyl-carrier-protein] reductase (NADH)